MGMTDVGSMRFAFVEAFVEAQAAGARCCATRRWARRPRSRPRRPRLPGSSPKRPPLRRARCLLGSIRQLSHSQRYQPLCQPSAPASRGHVHLSTCVSDDGDASCVVSGYCEGTMKIFGCLHRTLKISGRLHPFSHHSESTLKTFGLLQTHYPPLRRAHVWPWVGCPRSRALHR